MPEWDERENPNLCQDGSWVATIILQCLARNVIPATPARFTGRF